MEPNNGALQALTIASIEEVIQSVLQRDAPQLDLRAIRFIDPYALLLLGLVIRQRTDRGTPLDIQWPASRAVYEWMEAMRFFADLRNRAFPNLRPRTSKQALQPITAIEDEHGIGAIVDGFEERLSDRYTITAESRIRLVQIMLELFQNIPQHANATGEVEWLHGRAAMQDDEDGIFLAIADDGVGFRGSLSLREELGVQTDAQALDAIVFQGLSRFGDPGRGGELQRIARLVRSWDGSFALRSGRAVAYFDEFSGDIANVTDFPGVQIGIRFPHRTFGVPPIDDPLQPAVDPDLEPDDSGEPI